MVLSTMFAETTAFTDRSKNEKQGQRAVSRRMVQHMLAAPRIRPQLQVVPVWLLAQRLGSNDRPTDLQPRLLAMVLVAQQAEQQDQKGTQKMVPQYKIIGE